MTLSELADHICTRSGYVETDDVAAAKLFLSKRHELIWNDQLWKDSLVQFRQTLSPDDYTPTNTWLPEAGVLLCPKIIKQVVAARTDDMSLRVERPEVYFRVDCNTFASTGVPVNFEVLPPVVWQVDAARMMLLGRAVAGDNAVTGTADVQTEDTIEIERVAVVLGEERNEVVRSAQVDALNKATTTGAVTLQAAGQAVVSGAGEATANGTYTQEDEFNDKPRYRLRNAAGTLLATLYWTPLGLSPAWVITVEGSGLGYQYGVFSSADTPDGLTDWLAVGFTEPGPTAVTADADTTLVTLAAGDRNAEKRQRIRLIWRPDQEVNIRVLGKRRAPQFSADNDEPAINGVELCLMAFAEGDLLRRAGENGKAQGLYEEAIGLLEQLKRLETTQQAHTVRIMVEAEVCPLNYGVGPWY